MQPHLPQVHNFARPLKAGVVPSLNAALYLGGHALLDHMLVREDKLAVRLAPGFVILPTRVAGLGILPSLAGRCQVKSCTQFRRCSLRHPHASKRNRIGRQHGSNFGRAIIRNRPVFNRNPWHHGLTEQGRAEASRASIAGSAHRAQYPLMRACGLASITDQDCQGFASKARQDLEGRKKYPPPSVVVKRRNGSIRTVPLAVGTASA